MRTLLLLLLFSVSTLQAQNSVKPNLAKPTDSQMKWAEAEIGVIIHFDINIYAPLTFNYAQRETLPLLSLFKPQKLDTDQWLISAKKLGAKYAVLAVKAGTGFSLWPTKAHGYHIGNTSYKDGKGDIVTDFIASCIKQEIKPGICYNTNYNTLFGVGYAPVSDRRQLRYNEMVYRQLSELLSNYGELFGIWFDGGVGEDVDRVAELIKQHQPNAVLYQGPPSLNNQIRWVGNESGQAPYPNWSTIDSLVPLNEDENTINSQGVPGGAIWARSEASFANRYDDAWQEGWLWYPNQDYQVVAADDILNRYYTSVGQNSNMLVGMVIDTMGLFPQVDSLEFVKFGFLYNQVFKKVLAEVRYVYGKNIELNLGQESRINNIVIQEDTSYGERIRTYRIDYDNKGRWCKLFSGESVGYKRIHQIDENDTIQTSKLRIVVEKQADIPMFKSFRVY